MFLEIVIKNKAKELLDKDSGFLFLLENNWGDDLRRLHRLTEDIDICRSLIGDILSKYIMSKFNTLINENTLKKPQKNHNF